MRSLLTLLVVLLLQSCGPSFYSAPTVLDVTKHGFKPSEVLTWPRTPKGAYIKTPKDLAHKDFYRHVDEEVSQLSACLLRLGLRKESIRFEKLALYVPPDWYNSTYGEQLIPSTVDAKLCNTKLKKLGLPPIEKKCEWLHKPTRDCPNVCNVRGAIIDGFIVAFTPNRKLLKAELARLVLYPRFNNPWIEPLNQCLSAGKP